MNRPDKNRPLIAASRYIDANVEEKGLPDALAALGLDIEEVIYAARQRAIRVVMVRTGREDEIEEMQRSNERRTLPFNQEDSAQIDMMTAVYMDAFAIGWYAKQMEDA